MIDVNAYLGPFAFRCLMPQSAAGLVAQMDRYRIEKAWVSNAAAITYRNSQAGNEELAAEVGAHADRLIPFAVLNPAYAGWRDDLRICREEFGCRGLRLYPRWHHYRLTGPDCIELVTAAAAQGMIGNGSGFIGTALGRGGGTLGVNYSIETALLTAAIQNELGRLLKTLGPERLLFGTGMPFHYPDPAILKVEILEAEAKTKALILQENARRLLDLSKRALGVPPRELRSVL